MVPCVQWGKLHLYSWLLARAGVSERQLNVDDLEILIRLSGIFQNIHSIHSFQSSFSEIAEYTVITNLSENCMLNNMEFDWK